jgi:hypothetical protein
MYITFIQDYAYKNVINYKKDETVFMNNEMFAKYLIRKRIAVPLR